MTLVYQVKLAKGPPSSNILCQSLGEVVNLRVGLLEDLPLSVNVSTYPEANGYVHILFLYAFHELIGINEGFPGITSIAIETLEYQGWIKALSLISQSLGRERCVNK